MARALPPLEDGFPVPRTQAPPNRPRKQAERRPSPWQELITKAQHGQSVLVQMAFLNTVKTNAKKAGVKIRWKDQGYSAVPGTYGRYVRVWFIKSNSQDNDEHSS